MSLKSWRKIGMNVWKKKLKILVIRPRQLASKQLKAGAYDLDVYEDVGWTSEKRIYANTFKTKKQALKYAKEYMKKH